MKLYIAEKPSVGKAIAAVLSERSSVKNKTREYIQGQDWCVAWAAGHLFELEEPDYYIKLQYPNAPKNAKGKIPWSLDHLPILPEDEQWSMKLSSKTAGLFKTIKSLIKQASVVVNAGDADRAGQAIIDNVLSALNYRKPVRRVLVTSLETDAVRRAVNDERDNQDYYPLWMSEVCRSRADWLYGMNFSRAVTLKARETGYGSVVSIGRVQTAVLSLVVKRDEEIANFRPVDYYVPVARLSCHTGDFRAKWKPVEGQAGLDEEGRLLDQRVAQQLEAKVRGQQGTVVDYQDQLKNQGAPMPFSLAKLQFLCGKKYGYSADQVLATVQALYETHKLVTYPRVDTGYLPEGLHAEGKTILGNLGAALSLPGDVSSMLDPTRKSPAWNDKKVTAHHGIIPTTVQANMSRLNEAERNLYREIALRYAAQFMPPRRYRAVSVHVNVQGELFSATGSTTVEPGWQRLYGQKDVQQDADDGIILPPLAKGDQVQCDGLDIDKKKTQPPKPFVESTLLMAMVHIHKFVTNEKIQAIFKRLQKEADSVEEAGIGTPATRHTFMPRLVKVGLLSTERAPKGKEPAVRSTDAGRALIAALPGSLGKPDVTALWEVTLKDIAEGKATKDRFMAMQGQFVTKILEEIKGMTIQLPCSSPNGRAGSKSGGRSQGGEQRAPARPADKNCPKCDSQLMIRAGRNGDFMGCSAYPNCKHTEQMGG